MIFINESSFKLKIAQNYSKLGIVSHLHIDGEKSGRSKPDEWIFDWYVLRFSAYRRFVPLRISAFFHIKPLRISAFFILFLW